MLVACALWMRASSGRTLSCRDQDREANDTDPPSSPRQVTQVPVEVETVDPRPERASFPWAERPLIPGPQPRKARSSAPPQPRPPVATPRSPTRAAPLIHGANPNDDRVTAGSGTPTSPPRITDDATQVISAVG